MSQRRHIKVQLVCRFISREKAIRWQKDWTFWGASGPGRLCRWCSGKEFICQCKKATRCEFDHRVGKISRRRAWQPTPVFLPGEPNGQRSLAGFQSVESQSAGHDWESEQNVHVWTEQSDLFLQFVSLKDLEKEDALSEAFWDDVSKFIRKEMVEGEWPIRL